MTKKHQPSADSQARIQALAEAEPPAEDPRDRADALVDQIAAAAHLLAVIGISPAALDEMSPHTLATTAFDIMERCKELERCLTAMAARERELAALAA